MGDFFSKLEARINGIGQSLSQTYRANRVMMIAGFTIVSILLIVWARLGFTFEISRFFAAPVASTLSVQCGTNQNVLSWNLPSGSDSNSLIRNDNGADGVYICGNPNSPGNPCDNLSNTTFTDTAIQAGHVYTYTHKNASSAGGRSNSVVCPVSTPTATPSPVTLSATPTSGNPGSIITVSWTTISPATAKDWIGWFVVGAPDGGSSGFGANWMYVNCTKTATTAVPVGSCSFTIPAGTAVGSYQFRLFSNDGYTKLSTSNTVTVPSATTTVTPTPTPTPTGSSTPTPTPSSGAITCAPTTQTAAVGASVQVQGSGGVLPYTWSAGGPAIAGLPTSTTANFTWSAAGTYQVTVRGADNQAANCQVVVQGSGVVPNPTDLSLTVAGSNASTGTAESTTVNALSNQQVLVTMRVRNLSTTAALNNITVRAFLPSGLAYITGSTTVNNAPSANDAVTTSGLQVGSLGPQQTVLVQFRTAIGTFSAGGATTEITVSASADAVTARSGSLTVRINYSTGPITEVPTGPGDAVLVALLLSAITTLLYVSYTRSPGFQRREIDAVARQKDPLDFRS